jgi:MoaA/NifB/PqqE/SkfB family radical SAM enzyme
MKLEDIGFYTLEDFRAKNACVNSPLWRNEMIITSRCNFNCPYCRGTDIDGKKGDMPLNEVKKSIDVWALQNVKNVRFSGGEPTVHKGIKEIIRYTKEVCSEIEHIAISTNGYSDIGLYKDLIKLGVNDYSISLDACCSSIGDMMSGGVIGSWEKVVSNIRELSKLTYVTVGMVFDKQNSSEMKDSILFASNLGVSDIRIISAAQWNDFSIFKNLNIDKKILNKHPILKYRINNFKIGRNVRGITKMDSHKCGLMIDDTIIKGKYHYPCVIKMREGCKPIGVVSENMREERKKYLEKLNTYKDPICRKNCLDVCIDYNNKYKQINQADRTSA